MVWAIVGLGFRIVEYRMTKMGENLEFPKVGCTILGVPIIRATVFRGLYWGSLILGGKLAYASLYTNQKMM